MVSVKLSWVNAAEHNTHCKKLKTWLKITQITLKQTIYCCGSWDVSHRFHISRCLFLDPIEWNTGNVQKWLLWTEHLYRLPHAGKAFQELTGKDLCAMSEEEFRQRSPQCGDTLHAHLDIWKSGECVWYSLNKFIIVCCVYFNCCIVWRLAFIELLSVCIASWCVYVCEIMIFTFKV